MLVPDIVVTAQASVLHTVPVPVGVMAGRWREGREGIAKTSAWHFPLDKALSP